MGDLLVRLFTLNLMAAAVCFVVNALGNLRFNLSPKKVRELVGLKYRQRAPKGEILVEQWIGISLDELQRMKDSHVKWIRHRWPLIEKRMTRGHCLEWMERNGYPKPTKSACTFCPYHDNDTWRAMKQNDVESWDDAVAMDNMIRNGIRGTTQKLYLHQSMQPLEEVDFRNAEDFGQLSFLDECDGMCGV